MQQKPTKHIMSWKKFACLVLLIFVAYRWMDGKLSGQVEEATAQHDTAQMAVKRLELEHTDLANRHAQKESKQSIESAAREHHQYMYEDELVFEFDYPEKLKLYTQEELRTFQEEGISP